MGQKVVFLLTVSTRSVITNQTRTSIISVVGTTTYPKLRSHDKTSDLTGWEAIVVEGIARRPKINGDSNSSIVTHSLGRRAMPIEGVVTHMRVVNPTASTPLHDSERSDTTPEEGPVRRTTMAPRRSRVVGVTSAL